jgi:hypothetical protein
VSARAETYDSFRDVEHPESFGLKTSTGQQCLLAEIDGRLVVRKLRSWQVRGGELCFHVFLFQNNSRKRNKY